METPSGKTAESYMLWGEWSDARAVIKALWEKTKSLTTSMKENNSGDFYTSMVLRGIGFLLMGRGLIMKMTRMRELLTNATSKTKKKMTKKK